MNQAFSGTFSFGILIGSLVFLLRLSVGKKTKGMLGFFIWIFGISCLAFGFLNLENTFEWDFIKQNLKFQNALVGLSLFSFLSIFSYGFLNPPTKKKLKALLRLPMIGILGFWILRPEQIFYAVIGTELIMLAIGYKYKFSHQYLWRAQVKACLVLPLAFFYQGQFHYLFLFWFLWSMVFKVSMTNAAIVKGAMVDYDETLHEK